MRSRWLRAPVALIALACGGGGAPTTSTPAQEHTDLATLQGLLKVPSGVVDTRFTVTQLGTANSLVPGPTDHHVEAWMRVDEHAWPRIEADWGAPKRRSQPMRLSSDTVHWLSPSGPWPSLQRDGTDWVEPEPQVYSGLQLGLGAFRASEAVRLGDSGLYVTGLTL